MKNLKIQWKTVAAIVACFAVVVMFSVGCNKEEDGNGGGSGKEKKIENEKTAKELSRVVRHLMDDIHYELEDGFPSGMTLTSSGGSVTVEGSKTTDKNGPGNSGSGHEYNYTDISVTFSNFSTAEDLKIISGTGTYYRYDSYDYRNWGSVSSTKLSVSYSLSSCKVKFTYLGETYNCTVSISYSAPSPSARFPSGTVSVEGGETFSFYYEHY